MIVMPKTIRMEFPDIKAWKSRMLDSVYPIVWMDTIHYEVTDERGVTRAIYNVLSIDKEGHKELYISMLKS